MIIDDEVAISFTIAEVIMMVGSSIRISMEYEQLGGEDIVETSLYSSAQKIAISATRHWGAEQIQSEMDDLYEGDSTNAKWVDALKYLSKELK